MKKSEFCVVVLRIHDPCILHGRGILCTLKTLRVMSDAALVLLVVVSATACRSVPSGDFQENDRAPQPVADSDTPDLSADIDDVVDETADLVHSHMIRMTQRQRIAQRFMTFVPRGFDPSVALGPRHGDVTPTFIRRVASDTPAGFIVYPWNYDSREELIALTGHLQSVANVLSPGNSFLISADQEGGRVAAFRFPDIVGVPSAADVARHGDAVFVERLAYVLGVELNAMGVNMNLAPVLDLTPIPDRSIIGDRAWGNDPDEAAAFAAAYVRGMHEAGVISTAKHFPGHGVTRVDSHGRLPIVEYRMEDLLAREIVPFQAAVDAGVPVIMTAHILFPLIDADYPVTLSPRFVHELLREELAFDGVVISDGLEMGALRGVYDIDTTLLQALRAGVDLILLYDRYSLKDMVDRVESYVEDGSISMAEVDRGVERVLTLKARHGLLD